MSTTYWCPAAWLPDGPASQVRLTETDGVISRLVAGSLREPDDVPLPGLVLPGLANVHSHAFHRALRGRTHVHGDFWTWRRSMYAVAAVLTPARYERLARAVFAEMVLAGVTAVGEFHYLHHRPDGSRYEDPNAMGAALRRAAEVAGVRLTLLDACYLTAGIGRPAQGVQARFSDGTAAAWAERVGLLRAGAVFRVGAAVHSVRAVPVDDAAAVARWARERGLPLHLHLSEQRSENDECLAAYGRTPTQVLAAAGVLGRTSTVVHGVHLTEDDIATLGRSGTSVCLCPTTERDLADGIAPAPALLAAGSPLCLGSDQNAAVDLLAEAHALEMHARLAGGRRGVLEPAALVRALTVDGHRAIGWPEAGRLAVGAPADLVAVRTDTVRTVGAAAEQLVMVATAADVDTVLVGGEIVVSAGRHRLGDVADLLAEALDEVSAAVDEEGAP